MENNETNFNDEKTTARASGYKIVIAGFVILFAGEIGFWIGQRQAFDSTSDVIKGYEKLMNRTIHLQDSLMKKVRETDSILMKIYELQNKPDSINSKPISSGSSTTSC